MSKILYEGVPTLRSEDRSRAIGGILVEQGLLTLSEAEQIESYASENGLRFGDAAVRLNRLTQSDVELAVAQQFNYPILSRGGKDGVAEDVVAAYSPQSELIEPLRAIRSLISLRWLKEPTHKLLAITSADRREGRSWLAANLATVFAQIGHRTLLIDADMRHPRQHVLFNLNNDVGLSALVTGRAGREVACRIHPKLRLFVVPAGILPPNPHELMARPIFGLVLQRFAEQFDIVLIDTPAMSETADTQIIAARAGTAVMLVRRNRTRCGQLAAAMQSLHHADVSVIGSVYNKH
jgi:chain length determinant protein tyrosine kinase EpsG